MTARCRSALKVAAIGSPPQQEEGGLHDQEKSRSLISSCRRGGVVQEFPDHTTPVFGHPSSCRGGELGAHGAIQRIIRLQQTLLLPRTVAGCAAIRKTATHSRGTPETFAVVDRLVTLTPDVPAATVR